MDRTRRIFLAGAIALLIQMVDSGGHSAAANELPVAEAGLPGYAAQDAIRLDGSASYTPDPLGLLSYAWTQVSGPPLAVTGADTATPTISGFVQTDAIQECSFQLVVNDGQQASSPDTVKVVIVPYFGPSTLKLENPPFDANKPTVIYFGGGDCVNGNGGQPWPGGPAWTNGANVIDFPNGYTRDSGTAKRTYYKYGDMMIAYLSAVAPRYRQAIQTIGWSTGADPAIDIGIRLNEAYRDARYAVNHVTHLDGGCRVPEGWSVYLEPIQRFVRSSVAGEQCWIDHYYGTSGYASEPLPPCEVLLVRSGLDHPQVRDWYRNSLTGNDTNKFNNGLVGGAYWSVLGPGKNLQLAPEPGVYYFLWNGSEQNGAMGSFNQSKYPGRLPEPVTLWDWHDPGLPEDDPNGAVLTCTASENAVGYQLLSGSDPYNVADYNIVADSNSPPAVPVTEIPSADTWWTVKVRDAYGSTIYADPVRVDLPAGVIAYWKLDEASGVATADSVGTNNGTL
ncbi:MAG: PKD domain-containing protein, partial [Solirubrobacterales bacterium]